VEFTGVLQTGYVVGALLTDPPPPPAGYALVGPVFDLITTAIYAAPAQVCIEGTAFAASDRLVHYEGQAWVDVTLDALSSATRKCGAASSLSPWGVIRPMVATPRLTAVGPAKLWVGLKNSDAVGLRLDIRTEMLVNGIIVAAGEVTNVAAGSSGFNNALLHTLPMTMAGGAADLRAGTTMALRASVRRTCFGTGHNSGTARLWFNGAPVDSGAGRDAGSRLAATIDVSSSQYFLRSGFVLHSAQGSARQSVDAAVNSNAACPARPYAPLGTWTMTLP
jgi:hypothetical protein